MGDGNRFGHRMIDGMLAAVATTWLVAAAPPPEPIIECPGSHAHVWNKSQCDKFDIHDVNGGGDSCSGFLCGLPILGGLFGGHGLL